MINLYPMASHLVRLCGVFRRVVETNCSLRCVKYFSSTPAWFKQEERYDGMAVTDDNSMIVCWHPEKSFPYECSRPLPESPAEDPSILKSEIRDDPKKLFRNMPEEMVREELMKLTYTTKHRWFPRPQRKFAKKTPPDREYL